MIMLMIQTAFTVLAWKNGWRWKVLLPWVVYLGLGFILAIILAASGVVTSNEDPKSNPTVVVFYLLLELGLAGTLALMARKSPKSCRLPVGHLVVRPVQENQSE